MPRPEIDLVAYKAGTGELLSLECKSYFDSGTDLYGGAWNLFANTLKNQGIEVRFVDPADPDAFIRATNDRTRAWYVETLPNPKLVVAPIGEIAASAVTRHPADRR